MSSAPDPDNVGEYLISSRSFEEYERMFMLTESDLGGRLRSMPSRSRHSSTVLPENRTVEVPTRRPAWADTDGISMGNVEGHRALRKVSATAFARDFAEHPERYVSGSLPHLPFEDRQFDLVLSSHLLFTYADRLDLTFHCDALMELHRVSRGDVRVFPLVDQAGNSLNDLISALLASLARRDVEATISEVPYEFQRGGNQMLVLVAH